MDPNAAIAEYNTAKDNYSQFASGAGGFAQTLRESISKDLKDNQDLISQVAAGEESYYNAPSNARATYADVTNPFQKEALVQSATGVARQGWTIPQQLLQSRMGDIKDIVGNITTGYQTDVKNKQDLAQMAWQEYQQSISEQQFSQQLAKGNGNGNGAADKDAARLQSLVDNGRKTITDVTDSNQAGLKWATTWNNIKSEFPELKPEDIDSLLGFPGGWKEYAQTLTSAGLWSNSQGSSNSNGV